MTMTPGTTVQEKYAGDPSENYERYFVPPIGLPFARPVLQAARLGEGERVLDVACGTGVAARLALEAVGPTGKVAGVDLNPDMLNVARRGESSIEWGQADAQDLPYPDDSFDAVLCSLGFQFIPDKVQALREMYRVLTPDGRVVLSTPGPTPPLFQAIDEVLLQHVGSEASAFVNVVFSVHEPSEVRSMLETAGFTGVEIEYGPLSLRVPPPADFFWQYVLSTPLAMLFAQLDRKVKEDVERDVIDKCRPFVNGDGLSMEPGLLLAMAVRP